ncbi:GyrI-like domain-containing protein [Devosia nitrariae]|uniref:AraC effector-binding domain-containing protein n=1 Tax=Devosia nitrariae TaxID=2071872 RepID=A0ABQ5W9F0_9HYPH|nr:GyrI-like domain-containing protein [Devosia nitrariae]GLQ56668.1 hypothetical protein GCM10010862_39270 [Devosia nitrariae]
MLTLPEFVERDAQPYPYIPYTVPMDGIDGAADEGFPRLFAWMKRNGVVPVGAPFINYRRIDMMRTLDIEIGAPVAAAGEGDDGVHFSQLPAGRFARVVWTGPYNGLRDVMPMFIGWAKEKRLAWDVEHATDGERFACRLQIHEIDPSEERDPQKWVTQVAIKLADEGRASDDGRR